MLRTNDFTVNKMDLYLNVYHRLMAPWNVNDIRLLEIGI